MRLIDAPVGLFMYRGTMALKTEYSRRRDEDFIPNCYIVETGEVFCGGAKTADEYNSLEVTPIEAEPVRHGRWVNMGGFPACSTCGTSPADWEAKPDNPSGFPPYCHGCGAKMDAKEN